MPEPREHPILFSTPMVRAILEGRPCTTRRIVRGPVDFVGGAGDRADLSCWGWWQEDSYGRWAVLARGLDQTHQNGLVSVRCPYGVPGDRLWVRETFMLPSWANRNTAVEMINTHGVEAVRRVTTYMADDSHANRGRVRSGRFLPRQLSRLTLELTEVRVQRLNSISDEDAIFEGVSYESGTRPAVTFAKLWDSLNAKRGFSWQSNPWVWILAFRKA